MDVIRSFIKKYNIIDDNLHTYSQDTLEKIANILSGRIDDSYDDAVLLNYAEKYYLMAIKNGNVAAINNLAYLYENQNNNGLAEKYYLMAIENRSVRAMRNLAYLYDNQNNNELAEKYHLMASGKILLDAVENKNTISMNNSACLYFNQNNYELSEKYYLMAVENGNVIAINNLACLYQKRNQRELAEKYYLMAIEMGSTDSMNDFIEYTNNYLKVYHALTKIENKNNVINSKMIELEKIYKYSVSKTKEIF